MSRWLMPWMVTQKRKHGWMKTQEIISRFPRCSVFCLIRVSTGASLSPNFIFWNACIYCVWNRGLVSSWGIQILPLEMQRMFDAEHAVALGACIGVCGLSQLVSPIAGLLSDRCASSWGRRRPFFFWSSFIAAFLLVAMWYCRTHSYGGMYICLLFFSMWVLWSSFFQSFLTSHVQDLLEHRCALTERPYSF